MPETTTSSAATTRKFDLLQAADRLLAKLPGNARQSESIAREGSVSVVMMAMEAGDALKEHSAPGAVVVQLLRGHAILTAGGKSFDLRPAEMIVMRPGVRHDVRAEEQSVLLLTVTGSEE